MKTFDRDQDVINAAGTTLFKDFAALRVYLAQYLEKH